MGTEENVGKKQHRLASEKYIDSHGAEQIRASGADFQTLPVRYIESITKLPGFQEDDELREWMGSAIAYYDAGEYSKAQQFLTWALKRMPTLEPYIFYYMRVCAHVLSTPLERDEIEYEAKLTRWRGLPKWLRWTMRSFEFCVRCKWCGRYTIYIEPNVPTFGFNSFANSCEYCGRMYPMPSSMWDSPAGRAYSYYRMSFSDEEFYQDFERDYDPKPLCQRRRG